MDRQWTVHGQTLDCHMSDNGQTVDSPWTANGRHRLD